MPTITLPINESGLNIYLTGDAWNWQRKEETKYAWVGGAYRLSVEKRGASFKHFALCDSAQASSVANTLSKYGYNVTGDGDLDPSGKKRIWFLLPSYAEDGGAWPFTNNKW